MKRLDVDQIQTILEWMKGWEQIRDTVIPIRFKYDFQDKGEKPPLGLIPAFIRKQQRQQEIMSAVVRYREAGKEVPREWLEEFAELSM
jgi:hypothetical protein